MTSTIDIWNMALDYCGATQKVESEDDQTEEAEACARHWEKTLRKVLEARPWPFARGFADLEELDEISDTTAYADAVAPYTQFQIPGAFINSSQIEVVHTSSGGTETELEAGTDYTIDDGNETLTLADALTTGESVTITVSYSRPGWDHLYALPSDYVAARAIIVGGTRHELIGSKSRIPYTVLVNDGRDGKLLCCDVEADDIDALEYTPLITDTTLYSGHFIEVLAWALAVPLVLALRKDPQVAAYCQQQHYNTLAEAAAFERNIGHDSEPDSPSVMERG